MTNDLQLFKDKLLDDMATSKLEAPSPEQLNKMAEYYDYLVQQNKLYNLTRITDPISAATDHFCDSLLPLQFIGQDVSIIDIGSGAGFPIAPIAIMRPNCRVTAIEASAKKCAFISEACNRTGVKIDVINGRAEELARTDLRERFDICVSRAVAPMNILTELASPFIKPGGLLFAYKSDVTEIAAANSAAKALYLQPCFCTYSFLPQNGRKVFAYLKTAALPPKFPRTYAKIKKAPL